VADVEAANSAGEIEVAIAVDVIDSGAFGARGEDGSSVRGAAGNGGFAGGPSRRAEFGPGISVRIWIVFMRVSPFVHQRPASEGPNPNKI